LNFAKGSAGEIRSQLYVAFAVEYIEKSELDDLVEKAKFLSGSITNHINSIKIVDD
jgi:four helix bundle protein